MVRRLSPAVVAVAAALAIAAPATAGYGPTVPPGPSIPGGFSSVIASKTFGAGGGTLAARAGKTRFDLHVQQGALSSPVQFTLTAPRLGKLGKSVPRGMVPTTGVALVATRPNGRFVTGTFGSNRIRLVVVDPRITTRSVVLVWNGRARRFTRFQATITAGRATFTLNRIQELLLASPK